MSRRSRAEYSGRAMALEEAFRGPALPERDTSEDSSAAVRMLPLVSRTFAINIRVLGARMRGSVRLAYLLCRACDALEDSWPGPPAEVGDRFDRFSGALAGRPDALASLAREAAEAAAGRGDLQALAALPAWLRLLQALPPAEAEPVRRAVGIMAAGMRRYAVRAAARPAGAPYLDDDAELTDYCYVVAGCVGEMLTRLHAVTSGLGGDAAFAARLALAPRVGEALQLTNIVLDLPADLPRGRCHLPAAWLAAHGLDMRERGAVHSPAARELALRLGGLAHAALDRVADYLDLVPTSHVRYRLFVLWPALWARASLHAALADPRFPGCDDRPRLTRGELWSSAARSLFVAGSHRGVRRLLGNPAR